jgi:dihydrofolate reductase
MAGFRPSPLAVRTAPIVAERMNSRPKVVFSRTLEQATWNNTKLVKGIVAEEVRKMKKEPGYDMAILGSGSIVSQLAQEGLIDKYHIVVVPVILGKGKKIFDGVEEKLPLKLTKTRVFGNGNVFLCYEPMA